VKSEPGADGESALQDDDPDVDALVAKLQARVEERRRSGFYPEGLEQELGQHAHRVLHHYSLNRALPDLRARLHDVEDALPFNAARIPSLSGVPGGEVIHRGVARVVGRQTQGALQEVEAFARPTRDAIAALIAAVEGLSETLGAEVDALTERQAAIERSLAKLQARLGGTDGSAATA